MAMFGSGLRALLGGLGGGDPHRPDASAIFTAENEAMKRAAGPRMFGGRMSLPDFIMLAGATAKDIGAGGGGSQNMAGAMGLLEQRRQQEANAPMEDAKRRLLMEQINRQLGAYGVADTANLTDEEKIALAFNPSELGKSFASGSDAYTLGRNDVRGFRNQPVMVNDAPPDPQVVSGRLVGADGRVIYEPPQFESVGENSRLVQLSPGVQAGGAPGGGFDAFYQNFLAPQEGGFAPDDGNGAPVNFGINQGANPDVDVRNLTQDQAKKLLHDRYWVASGADRLPGGLAEIHGDTAVNMGVGAAQQLLQQSGGDPNRYLQLREERYRSIAQADPSKAQFLPTWLRRNQQLAQFVGGAGQPAQGGGPRVVVDAAPKQQDAPFVPPPESGLRDIGSGMFRDRVGRIYQRNSAGALTQTAGVTDAVVAKTSETINEANQLLSAIDEFDAAVRGMKAADFSIIGKYTGDPETYARAKAAATNLQMLLKGPAAYNLGVLTGPDLAILEGVVADPAKFDTAVRRNQIVPALTQLSKGIGVKYRGTLDAFERMGGDPKGMAPLFRSPRSQIGKPRTPPPSGPVRVKTLQEAMKLKPGTVFLDPNGVRRVR